MEKECVVAEIMSALARQLNALNENEKSTRKRALEAIKKETIEKGLSSAVLQEVFARLLSSLLRCLSDPMERCREVAIQIIGDFIRCVSKPESSLPYLMPYFVQRLGGNEIVEPAEEVRLSMVEVLSLIVEICGKHLAPYLGDMINILQKTILDPFPDVKKESCKCTIHLARSIPEHFHMQAECLVKPLMQTISHQHSRVRMAVIEATGAVVLYGTGKTMDDVLSHMAQRLFDNSPQVRKAVTLVAGDWLLNLRDRYSYFHKLIPLLLSSYYDVPDIKALACKLWEQVGTQWEKENEDELKDKMDFLLLPPLQYPPGVERPGLGCRELVVRNLSKLMPAMSNEAKDWLVQTRVKTLQLLQVLLLHAEGHCTQHLPQLLTTLYHACTDPEQDVSRNGLESAKLLGVFVSPDVFLKLLLAHVKNPSLCSCSLWAPLMVLAEMLKGSNRKVLGTQLLEVGHILSDPDVCQETQQIEYIEQLLSCVEVLLMVCGEDCGIISLPLLKILVTVQCVSTEPQIHTKAEECGLRLCLVLGLSSLHELYREHMEKLLQWLRERSCSTYPTKKAQLEIIALQSGPVVGEFLPELIPLLQNYLLPRQDPQMRLHIFTMLSKLLLNSSNTLNSQGKFCEYLQLFLQELLLPNLVWHAGRVAAAVRTSALSCLLAMLQSEAISKEQVKVVNMETELSACLISALDEDSQLSRLLSCRTISAFITVFNRCLNQDTLNKIYPELLKRIDDSSQDVRAEALKALSVWLSSLEKNDDPKTYRPNLEFLFQHLLLYLDDPDHQIQLMVLEVLKAGSVADPTLLKQKVEEVKEKQRSSEYCEELLQYLQSL